MRPELIAILALAVAVPGAVVLAVALRRRQIGARLEAAERLGLAYSRDREGAARGRVLGPIRAHGRDRLVGTWRGRGARVDFARHQKGNHGATDYTRAVLDGAAPADLTVVVQRATLGTRVGEAMGLLHDLKTGDEALDRAWRIQGSPEGAVLELLRRPSVRAALDRDPATAALLAREGRLELLVRKKIGDAERLRQVLDLASDLADAVPRR